jgi:hypothetical protein
MLCNVVTEREQKSQPALPLRPVVIDLDGDANESTEAPTRPDADAVAVGASNDTGAPVEITEVSPDMPMLDIPANTTAGSETAAVETRKSNDAPIEVAEYSPNVSIDESADGLDETPAVDTSKSNDAPVEAAEFSPDVSMDGSADVLDETPAESGTGIPDDTAEAQVDVDDSPKSADAPTAGEAEAEPTGAVQTTESANEEPPATSISEEEFIRTAVRYRTSLLLWQLRLYAPVNYSSFERDPTTSPGKTRVFHISPMLLMAHEQPRHRDLPSCQITQCRNL